MAAKLKKRAESTKTFDPFLGVSFPIHIRVHYLRTTIVIQSCSDPTPIALHSLSTSSPLLLYSLSNSESERKWRGSGEESEQG